MYFEFWRKPLFFIITLDSLKYNRKNSWTEEIEMKVNHVFADWKSPVIPKTKARATLPSFCWHKPKIRRKNYACTTRRVVWLPLNIIAHIVLLTLIWNNALFADLNRKLFIRVIYAFWIETPSITMTIRRKKKGKFDTLF